MATYEELAKDNNNQITNFLIVEAINRDTLSIERFYFSDKYFIGLDSLTPLGVRKEYDIRLQKIPLFDREYDPLENEVVVTSAYTLDLLNDDYFFDNLDKNYLFKNQSFQIYSHIEGLDLLDSKLLATGFVEDIIVSDLKAQFKIRDLVIYEKTNNSSLSKFSDDDGLIEEDLKEENKPLLFGKAINIPTTNISKKEGFNNLGGLVLQDPSERVRIRIDSISHTYYDRKYYKMTIESLGIKTNKFKEIVGLNGIFKIDNNTLLEDSDEIRISDCRFKFIDRMDFNGNFVDPGEIPPGYNDPEYQAALLFDDNEILAYIEQVDEDSDFPQDLPITGVFDTVLFDFTDNAYTNNKYLVAANKDTDVINLEIEGFEGDDFFTPNINNDLDLSFLSPGDEIIIQPNLNNGYNKYTFIVKEYNKDENRIYLNYELPANFNVNNSSITYKYIQKIKMYDEDFTNKILEHEFSPYFQFTELAALAPGPAAPAASTMPYFRFYDESIVGSIPLNIGIYYEASDSGNSYNAPAGVDGLWYTILLDANTIVLDQDMRKYIVDEIFNIVRNLIPVATPNNPYFAMKSADGDSIIFKRTINSSKVGYLPEFITPLPAGGVDNAFRKCDYWDYRNSGSNTQASVQDHLIFDTEIINNNLVVSLDRKKMNVDERIRELNNLELGSQQFGSNLLIAGIDFAITTPDSRKQLEYIPGNFIIPGAAPRRKGTLNFNEGDLVYLIDYNEYTPFVIKKVDDNDIWCIEDVDLTPDITKPSTIKIRTIPQAPAPSEVFVDYKDEYGHLSYILPEIFEEVYGLSNTEYSQSDLDLLLNDFPLALTFYYENEENALYKKLNEYLESFNLVSYIDQEGQIRLKFNQTLNIFTSNNIKELDVIKGKFEKKDFKYTQYDINYLLDNSNEIYNGNDSQRSAYLDSISGLLNFDQIKTNNSLIMEDFKLLSFNDSPLIEHYADRYLKDTVELHVIGKADLLEYDLYDLTRVTGFGDVYIDLVFRVVQIKTDGNNVELTLFAVKPDLPPSEIIDENFNNIGDENNNKLIS